MALIDCRLVELPRIEDPRGNLTFIENPAHVPFEIRRVYYLYDVPERQSRGGHAHKQLNQLVIPIAGSFDILLDDGKEKKKFHLDKPFYGLYICPMIWRHIDNFSSDAICLVLASDVYLEDDYYRQYDDFLNALI